MLLYSDVGIQRKKVCAVVGVKLGFTHREEKLKGRKALCNKQNSFFGFGLKRLAKILYEDKIEMCCDINGGMETPKNIFMKLWT